MGANMIKRLMKPATLSELPLEEMDESVIPFPVYGTPKFDGIRCCIQNGKALTYNLKPIPNRHVRGLLESTKNIEGMDGELIVTHTVQDYFNNTQSGIMSRDGKPDFKFYIFDRMPINAREELDGYLKRMIKTYQTENKFIEYLRLARINNMRELLQFERDCLKKGFEGIILRTGDSPYKYGRSTLKQFWMVKYKRFQDGEARVVGFTQLLSNKNEKITDQYTGLSKRSSKKAGKVPMNMLGSLVVKDVKTGVQFEVSGFTLKQRRQIWRQRNSEKTLLDAIITYRYQAHGVKEKPRFPVYKGRRMEMEG